MAMTRPRSKYWLLLLAAIPLFLVFELFKQPWQQSEDIQQQGIHKVAFYDEELFLKGDNRTQPREDSAKITGGVIPHHLYASFIISDFFKRLSLKPPEVIVLIGPNHYERGDYEVLTSLYSWETAYGNVYPDKRIVEYLIAKKLAKVDEDTLSLEHSVVGIMPYIKFYLPNTRVVPLILSSRFDDALSSKLAQELYLLAEKNVIFVASVDFSHYLTRQQAHEKDKYTLRVMKNFDYKALYQLNNDYLDSPASIATLFKVMEKLGKSEFEVLYNTNSGELEKNDFIQTTSYFSLAFY